MLSTRASSSVNLGSFTSSIPTQGNKGKINVVKFNELVISYYVLWFYCDKLYYPWISIKKILWENIYSLILLDDGTDDVLGSNLNPLNNVYLTKTNLAKELAMIIL